MHRKTSSVAFKDPQSPSSKCQRHAHDLSGEIPPFTLKSHLLSCLSPPFPKEKLSYFSLCYAEQCSAVERTLLPDGVSHLQRGPSGLFPSWNLSVVGDNQQARGPQVELDNGLRSCSSQGSLWFPLWRCKVVGDSQNIWEHVWVVGWSPCLGIQVEQTSSNVWDSPFGECPCSETGQGFA